MQHEHLKTAVVAGWALGLGAVGVMLDLNSIASWTLLVALGLLPLVLFRSWTRPAETMSESIRDVLR